MPATAEFAVDYRGEGITPAGNVRITMDGRGEEMLMRRRASVESAAQLRPHDHTIWFGEGPEQLYEMASEAFVEGIRRNEKLMLVADRADAARLRGFAVEQLLGDGQLEVHDVTDVYGAGGFSASAQLATFQAVLADALAGGYSGLRVVADNTSLARGDDASFQRWLAWEQLTDHFQAESMVTGICFFDRTALSPERLADLTALHPMRANAKSVEPPFSLFADRDSMLLVGSLAEATGARLRRLLASVDFTLKPALDLSAAHPLDDSALLVLTEFASAERPLVLLGNDHLRARVAALGAAGEHLRVEHAHGPTFRCAACGDVIGVYESASILTPTELRQISTLAEPETVGHAVARFHSECFAAA
jgi:hypothetical protein